MNQCKIKNGSRRMREKPYEKRRSDSLVDWQPTTSKELSNNYLLLNNLAEYSRQLPKSTLSFNGNQKFNIFDYIDPQPLTIHGYGEITVNCLQEITPQSIKEEETTTVNAASENIASDLENINIKTEENGASTADTDMEQDDTSSIGDTDNIPKCNRTVFVSSEEDNYTDDPNFIHYLRTTKTFHQNIDKNYNNELPRKKVSNPWDSLNSVVHVKNDTIEKAFNELKKKFAREGKVDKYGKVQELLLFHGTSNESINKIIENNFVIDKSPAERSKAMLFGRGVYLSELPGVSLMYGDNLLLCKVILGKSEIYYPNGQTPPPIPDGYDSRIVIKDGLKVVTVVKNSSQILPYSIVNIKEGRIIQAGTLKSQQQDQTQQQSCNNIILPRG